MSTQFSETPESIQDKIQEQNLNYQQELKKGSGSPLRVRKEIRVKIRELKMLLEKLLRLK